jgi:hypothetical protein
MVASSVRKKALWHVLTVPWNMAWHGTMFYALAKVCITSYFLEELI